MNVAADPAPAARPLDISTFREGGSLNARLRQMHEGLLERVPAVDRIACALYDAGEDLLKTFIDSTRTGHSLEGHEFRLSQSRSLSRLATSGDVRILDDIPALVQHGEVHSDWLLEQGYQSSMTVPLFDNGALLGMTFFDARASHAFPPVAQRDLLLYANLINMSISSELAALRTVVASAQMAREFAHLRDFETGAHLERMARYARAIARAIAPRHALGDEFIEHVFLFAPLHDVGKIGIPDRILLKAGRLEPDERQVMQTHVELGLEIVERIIGDFGLRHLPDSSVLRNIVGGHHEKMNGTGYPKGLAGAAIPLEARIVSTADIFDALTTRRPYKQAWTTAEAVAEMRRMAVAGELDPECVEAVAAFAPRIEEIRARYPDED
jgi:HD-GYP domain-containing protein (c-di-GMP phosphodiesterase class II)